MNRCLFWALVLALFPVVGAFGFVEAPELPKRMTPPPGMVLARMTSSGDLVLRMLDTEFRQVPYSATSSMDLERTVNGVLQKEKMPFAQI